MSASTIALTLPEEALHQLAQLVAHLLRAAAPATEPWITTEEAAEHIGCNRDRIYYLVAANRIPHRKEGTRLMFRRSDLDAWIQDGDAADADD